MESKTLLKLVREIEILDRRLPRLSLANISNVQFTQEFRFLHQAIETLINSRRNDELYSEYSAEIETSIEVAGMLEESYNAEYQRRMRGI